MVHSWNTPQGVWMHWKYGLNESPPFPASIILGLQWAFIAISTIVILGKIVGTLHFGEAESEIIYLQKLFFMAGLTLLSQLLWGHRLPLIAGPSAVLLIGIISSRGFHISAIYTSMMIGGSIIGILAATGLFSYFRRLFTARVISVVLLLIVFTLAPTIRDLMVDVQSGIDPLHNITFAVSVAIIMFLLHKTLPGIWRMVLIICSLVCGSVAYFYLFPDTFNTKVFAQEHWLGFFFKNLTLKPELAPGVVISFLICYMALTVNDLGSIQSLNEMLAPDHKDRRINRGILLTGIANLISGFVGVIGPVNYSLSPGVITSTRCASRHPLFPAAIFILLLSFIPRLIGLLGSVPSVVIGGVMVYIMASQVSAGLQIAIQDCSEGGFSFENGIVIGMPVLLGNIIAFLPTQVLEGIPLMLRPILGNGFVAGIFGALFLEHIIFRK
jgi:xanthine/uracil permease